MVNYEIILPIWSALVLQFGLLKISCKKMDTVEGQITDFFHTPSLKPQKITYKNHKKITYRKHQKSQITEKLLKNHIKKSLESTKINKKNHRRKSCDFKITKIMYTFMRSDLPLGYSSMDTTFAYKNGVSFSVQIEQTPSLFMTEGL